MPYGIIKVDTITFTDAGVDKSIQISGLVQNPTFSGNVTCTGTISGVTVTGTVGAFTTVSGITVTGTTATFTSGNFTNISGGTYTITSGVFAAGSAASPSISFTGDSNTGLYSPGADQVAISTNGTGRLFVNSIGQVGVGKVATQLVDVETSGNAQVRVTTTDTSGGNIGSFVGRYTGGGGGTASTVVLRAGDGYTSVGASTNSPLVFINNETERMRLDTSGRLGLGTSSPNSLFTAAGGSVETNRTFYNRLASSVAVADRGLLFEIDGTQYGRVYAPNGKSVAIQAGSGTLTDAVTVDQSGRVGIGTTSPGASLHVAGITRIGANDASDANLEIGAGATGNRNAYIDLVGDTTYTDFAARLIRGNTGANSSTVLSHRGTGELSIQTTDAAPLTFYTTNTERARIDSSGRLLVGTSTARSNFFNAGNTSLFQVEGTGETSAVRNLNDAFGAMLLLGKSRSTGNTIVQSGDTIGLLTFQGNDGSEFVECATIKGEVDGTPGANDMPGRLVFSTTADGASYPTERMRIAQNGVVTIQNGAVAVIGTLTDAATITPDLAADCNFTVTLGGARTIANPTNITAGQSGSIFLVQDGTGGRTASWGSYWDFPGGTAPTLSTAANAVDRVDYIVRSSTSIHTVFTANYS